ncbi:MAG: NTP transferase domain-containing protein [Planctomycetes bacterium]|nr:NTP transferase domain-containing protein [Planctomycetota bacterium]MBU1517938.1 NTP transferase domain-containing protein [Planctomycetota bacterium]MBU2458193.1 NTP transferase domain-containing protein [Planctomycetota bacterium]
MRFAVIMAGGTGKRLWPLSRENRPKQVLKLIEGDTLLRRCYQRINAIFDHRHIIVLTNKGYADIVRENLPDIPYDNVIAEPAVRDTAGAIGLAASVLARFDPDATMAVVTADQVIKPAKVFHQALEDGMSFVGKNPDALITFGIQPSFPNTQLGYIKLGEGQKCPHCDNEIYPVEAFKEKPDTQTAKEYLSTGQYCWNSGLFVWKAKRVLELLFENLPQAKQPLQRIQADWGGPHQEETLAEYFIKLPKISIDFAVMEKAPKVHAIRLNCQWLDMGSFSALADIIQSDKNGNIVVASQSEVINCKNSVLVTEDKEHLIAAIGLENMVVVHSPDATLVCPIGETEKLKQLLEILKQHKKEKYL